MARNYVEFWSSRVLNFGAYRSFFDSTQQGAIDQANAYVNSFGGTIDWAGKRGYLLINKTNVIGFLQNVQTRWQDILGHSWVFFQDGGLAQKSPRDTWSHGE